MVKQLALVTAVAAASNVYAHTSNDSSVVRVATFNVSMEALNYIEHKKGSRPAPNGDELTTALLSQHQQIKNVAEIIQRTNPDILLLNEFDGGDKNKNAVELFLTKYLAKSQNGQAPVLYPYYYQAPVNTGVKLPIDSNNDGKITQPVDTYGFGYFPGHFSMVLLSKYPIDFEAIRSFQKFKWQDMPNALKPIDPKTNKGWYSEDVWNELRLSSKSHWDVPVKVGKNTIHVLASHPTPPVFDGPEDRNGKRNHDELRFWHDYISGEKANYIYDDNNKGGGLAGKQFVFLGDLNASVDDGDANTAGIGSILNHPKVIDAKPQSEAAKVHSKDNKNAQYHTAYWRMRADYVLPSKLGWKIKNSGVFWPNKEQDTYRLIKDRAASSDHRLVWVDLELNKK